MEKRTHRVIAGRHRSARHRAASFCRHSRYSDGALAETRVLLGRLGCGVQPDPEVRRRPGRRQDCHGPPRRGCKLQGRHWRAVAPLSASRQCELARSRDPDTAARTAHRARLRPQYLSRRRAAAFGGGDQALVVGRGPDLDQRRLSIQPRPLVGVRSAV